MVETGKSTFRITLFSGSKHILENGLTMPNRGLEREVVCRSATPVFSKIR